MKRIILVLLIICGVILVSCQHVRDVKNIDPHSVGALSREYDRRLADELMPKIAKAIVESDTKALKSLFSPYVLETQPDLERDIMGLFLAFEGEIVSYEKKNAEKMAASASYGQYTFKTTEFGYRTVETSTGKVYSILVYYTVVNDENPDEVGLTKIFIYDINDLNVPIARAGDFPLPQRPLL